MTTRKHITGKTSGLVFDLRPRTAKEWLERWDADETVFTVEMGGLSPGYEQAIQTTVAEMLRWFIDNKCDSSTWTNEKAWKVVSKRLEDVILRNKVVSELGLSGSQYGAAVSLASAFYMRGPRKAMEEKEARDRLIQVKKTFP